MGLWERRERGGGKGLFCVRLVLLLLPSPPYVLIFSNEEVPPSIRLP
jgi:hypothetical protein